MRRILTALIISLAFTALAAQTAIGDTLTVILKPLLNIPEIVLPGETFILECDAPTSTDNWHVELIHDATTIELGIESANYYTSLARWQIQCAIPLNPPLFELYDLHVTADGIEEDFEKNAVQLIPEERDTYSFIHVTDPHTPTSLYYYEDGAETDSTNTVDLRQVIQDINIINPEFVLLTGDLVNEGELEDFLERRYFTRAKRLLTELEVPVFVTSGNHDIGGWDSTPPEDGTARRNWWKFFGWNRLIDPPSGDPYYTQNYSFDYGDVHYMGMEAYDNYDNFMSWIYGFESFTDGQMQWLEDELASSQSATNRVLFYHYDFSEQIDLNDLDVDLALWGHIHYNEGSTHYHPYNLATDNTGDHTRAYRPIHVSDNIVDPQETVYAGYSGQNLRVTYTPSNEGVADSIQAVVHNGLEASFTHCRLKFVMPSTDYGYIVTGGELEQTDRSGEFVICYVTFDLPEGENATVTISTDYSIAVDPVTDVPTPTGISTIAPNPFNPQTCIYYSLSHESDVLINIYTIRGARVTTMNPGKQRAGSHSIVWDAHDRSSGIYLVELVAADCKSIRKAILLK